MQSYPWYELVSGSSILQGDFIDRCTVIVPCRDTDIPASEGIPKLKAGITEYNVIVMSQSCDIEQGKVDLVLVSPSWPLEKLGEKNSVFKSPKEFLKWKNELRKGNALGYHLLNKCELEGVERNYMVVDFRNVYSLPLEFLKVLADKADKRIRLLPPYREHLSQAFARFFMRVGLPADIPPFC